MNSHLASKGCELPALSKLVEFSKSPSFFRLRQSKSGNLFVPADLESERRFADNMEPLGFQTAGDALAAIQCELDTAHWLKPYVMVGNGKDKLIEWSPKLKDMLRDVSRCHVTANQKRTMKKDQRKKEHMAGR